MAEKQDIAQEFVQALGAEHVALPGSKEYGSLQWYNSANYEAKPICLVTPSTASHVSKAIKLIKEKDLNFGIRSGGLHVCNGFSNADGGVLISFERYMNKVQYEKGSKVAFLDPGARWSEVYDIFQPFGVQPVGGRVTSIGVGGFLCGGGMSFLTSKYGLGCDNVESFEAVLASGEIVKATRTNEHKGLFFALKGGGNRFAVVTKFEVLVHPVENVYAGAVNLTSESMDKALEALHDFIENNEDDNANVLFNLIEAGGQETSNIPRCYLEPDPPKTGPFAAFENLEGTKSEGAAIPYKKVTDQTTFDCWGPHFWPFWQCATYKSSVALMKHCKVEFDKLRAKVKSEGVDAWSVSMHFEPLSKRMVEIGYEKGGNAFGAGQDAPYFWCLVVFNCGSRAGQEKAEILGGEYMKAVDAFARKDRKNEKLNLEAISSFPISAKDIDPNFKEVPSIPEEATGLPLYPNNASPAQLPSVTSTALPLLQIAKQRYDPDGFFSKKTHGFSI